VGDPSAQSDTFKALAWPLFVETVYEYLDNISLVEERYLTSSVTSALGIDANGTASWLLPFENYAQIRDVMVNTGNGYIPATPITPADFARAMDNPFTSPCSSANEYFYYYDGKYLNLLCGMTEGTLTVSLRVYADVATLLGSYSPTDTVPLHNKTIYGVVPLVVDKLKKEIGLVL